MIAHPYFPEEFNELLLLSQELTVFEFVMLALQRESIDLAAVWVLFDEALKTYLDVKCTYLHKNNTIVTCGHFVNGGSYRERQIT